MTKKEKRVEGAKLSEVAKLKLKIDIYTEFPALKAFDSMVDHLIDTYSESDKKIIDKLMEKANPVEDFLGDKADENVGEIRTYSPNDGEYWKIMREFEKARQEDNKRREEIAKKAEEEMKQKGVELSDNSIKNVSITQTS